MFWKWSVTPLIVPCCIWKIIFLYQIKKLDKICSLGHNKDFEKILFKKNTSVPTRNENVATYQKGFDGIVGYRNNKSSLLLKTIYNVVVSG